MVIDFKNLRPPANYPVYPPYHRGDYIEEYFYKFYLQNKQKFDETGHTLIPVFWTNIYITNINRNLLQPYLDALPPGKYFTVSQHDDAVTEKLPDGTISFEAGGNKNGIPIPLICSSIISEPTNLSQKNIFCSFVGSIISGSLREQIYSFLRNDKDFYFSPQHWTPSIEPSRLQHFIDITKQSIFTLCPRGYGAQSFRIYETIQLQSIPVIVYDKPWFPFAETIEWKEFSVLIHVSELSSIKEILLRITKDQQNKMIETGQQIYKKYFTLEGMSNQILETLKRL